MEFGIGSYTYGWAVEAGAGIPGGLDETLLFHRARAFGVSCLQIGDNLPLHEFSQERLEAFRALLATATMRFELGARGLTASRLKTYLDLAVFFSSPLLRFVIDDQGYEPSLRSVAEILKAALPEIAAANVHVAIENHDRFKAQDLAAMIREVDNDRVGICLDCANSLGANEGLDWVAPILAPYTLNLHLKDFTITRLPHKMGFTVAGVPAGQGMLDIPGLLARLAPFNRCQSAILELWTSPEPDLTTTLLKEQKWAQESLKTLSPYFLTHMNYTA